MQHDKPPEKIFRDQLTLAMDRCGIPPMQKGRIAGLARLLDISQITVRRWLDPDEPTLPNTATLIEIAQKLNVSLDSLLGLEIGKEEKSFLANESTHHAIPICEIIDGKIIKGRESYIHKEADWIKGRSKYYAFVINSDAMFPVLEINDVAIVETVDEIIENKIYALYFEGRVFFRRVIPIKNMSVAIMAENKQYPNIEFESDEFTFARDLSASELPQKGLLVILGRVLASVKKFV